jgi:hypothetical protein
MREAPNATATCVGPRIAREIWAERYPRKSESTQKLSKVVILPIHLRPGRDVFCRTTRTTHHIKSIATAPGNAQGPAKFSNQSNIGHLLVAGRKDSTTVCLRFSFVTRPALEGHQILMPLPRIDAAKLTLVRQPFDHPEFL